MTMSLDAPVVTRHQLLLPQPATPLPTDLHAGGLIALLEEAGLTGRGGAGFPTATKLRAVAGRSPVVVGNAMEGEPASHKDATLVTRNPSLVLDGLVLLGRALEAHSVVLAVGHTVDDAPARTAATGRGVEVRRLSGGFVAGQESALVRQLGGGPAVPADPLVPVRERGLRGRPTLVVNAETAAQIALLVRHGVDWFRGAGTPTDPGTFLATVSGSSPTTVSHPGVIEVDRGTPLRQVLARAGATSARGVLVGGHHGVWVRDLDTRLDRDSLAPAGTGAGVLIVLDHTDCPIEASARILEHLAASSARQCGPCLNGLPRLAALVRRLTHAGADPATAAEVARVGDLITGRGACAHPDASARMAGSMLTVFADHVAAHLEGRCPR